MVLYLLPCITSESEGTVWFPDQSGDVKGVRINRAEKKRFVLFNTPFSVLFNRASKNTNLINLQPLPTLHST